MTHASCGNEITSDAPCPALPLACREDPARPYVAGRPAAAGVSRSTAAAVRAPVDLLEASLRRADAMALSVRGALDRICLSLARAATAFVRAKAWDAFGFARLDDHGRERFGRSGRWVRDLAALGETLASLPALGAALTGEDGALPLGRVAALLVGRAAGPDTLAAWIALARAVPVRDLRVAVRQSRAAGSSWPPGCAGLCPLPPDGADATPPARACAAATPPSLDPAVMDDVAERSLIRIPVPSPLLAAFDEAVELFRCVEGTEASVTSFIEALVAEAHAGAHPPEPDVFHGDDAAASGARASRVSYDGDFERVSLRRGDDIALVETSLARSTGNWSHLPLPCTSSWARHLAGAGLARLDRLSRAAGLGGPADLDVQLRDLIALENDLESRLGRLLAGMAERGAWSRLRFAGVGHYAEERLGLSRTAAADRLRAARALRRYPLLRAAYEQGRIGLEATLLALRLLGPGPVARRTEAAWLARLEEATVKRLRDEARALARHPFSPGPPPDEPAAPIGHAARARQVTSIEPGARAALADALDAAPEPLDDRSWHASLHREPGTARRRVLYLGHLTVHWSEAPGVLPGPDDILRLRLPHDVAEDFLAVVESIRRALTDEAGDHGPYDQWSDPYVRPSILAGRTFSTRRRRVPAWAGLLGLLEDFVLTWDVPSRTDDRRMPGRPPLPRTSPAPRRGDAIYIRDGWRCSAPACTSRRNLEDHHIVYKSHLGDDASSNRICLCRFHHQRGEHGLLTSCSGAAPLGVIWRLGRLDTAAWYRNERRQVPGEATDGSDGS